MDKGLNKMYSTKEIEKILLAEVSRKPVLARKIHYVNKPTKKSNIILVGVDRRMPDYIFLYYFDYKEYKKKGYFRNSIEKAKSTLWKYIYNNLGKIVNGYVRPTSNRPQLPFYYQHHQFVFLIYPTEKIIITEHTDFPYGNVEVNNIYSNEDTKKILKDLIKNNIITNDYKLKINDNEYSVNEIVSNKNMPIKYTKNGNLLMYHGTRKASWEQIKKTGGLKPQTNSNFSYGESFTDSLIYLTTSFVVAKSYASRGTRDPNESVILLVEVPDMNKLYVDTFSMEDGIVDIIYGIKRENSIDNNKFFVNFDTNKDVIEFRKQYLEPDGSDMIIKGLGEHKISFDTRLCYKGAILKAVIDEDFSVIERQMQNDKRSKYSELSKLNDEEFQKALDVLYALYKIIIKYYANIFNNNGALRESMNSLNNKNAVAYHGRIPLSYIRGVFDINGNKIE